MVFLAYFKNSGKLKSKVRPASDAPTITCYLLPEIHKTRLINHWEWGFIKILHCWSALKIAFENIPATDLSSGEDTKAKIFGICKKLKSYCFVCQIASYLDILESTAPPPLVFEKRMLMIYDVEVTVEKCLLVLEDLKVSSFENVVDSFFRRLPSKIKMI